MAKLDARFRDGHQVIVCSRCGAPGNVRKRGGQLVPVKGFQTGRRYQGNRVRRLRMYEHADSAFCEKRIPHAPLREIRGNNK